MKEQYLKVDDRARISLAKITKSLPSHYKAYTEGDRIILEPIVEIPEEEKWLFKPENKHLLEEFKRGLEQKSGFIKWSDIKKDFKDLDLDSDE